MKFKGKVIRGSQLGTKFGIATANLEVGGNLDLEEGIYFVRVKNKQILKNSGSGVLFIGSKKTFGEEKAIEVHVLDLKEDLYDQNLEVEVLQRTRDIEKFRNAEELFEQIKIDIVRTRKFFLRQEVFEKWKRVSDSDLKGITELLNKKVVQHDKFQEAKRVFVYAPTRFEIPFVENMCKSFPDKKYFFPKVVENGLQFYEAEFEDLRKGAFGILEPLGGESFLPEENDIVFIPAVAIDHQLNRLGRGKRLYDGFLKNTKAWKISVVPEFAYVPEVSTEEHDVKVDEVLRG